jgi:low affinity Fe/Cu permease
MKRNPNSALDYAHRAEQKPSRVNELFHSFSRGASWALGTPWAFIAAIAIVVVWAVTGPIYNYSNTWQLVINTGTTIVTFLMVFLIQNTQNRDSKAIHLKLDELIASLEGPRNKLVDVEDASEEEMERREAELKSIRETGGHQASKLDDDADDNEARDSKRRPDDKQRKPRKAHR